jgi:hypothetical protein
MTNVWCQKVEREESNAAGSHSSFTTLANSVRHFNEEVDSVLDLAQKGQSRELSRLKGKLDELQRQLDK